MRNALLLAILIALSPPLSAASQFWVCVATAEDPEGARLVASEGTQTLHEPLQVRAVDTSDGVRQRILAGPYATHAAALASQQQAQQAGYVDSWIYAEEPGDALGTGFSNTTKYSDEMPAEQNNLDPFQSPVVRAAIETGRLPDEIPPGYQLNKLYRDGAVPTPELPK